MNRRQVVGRRFIVSGTVGSGFGGEVSECGGARCAPKSGAVVAENVVDDAVEWSEEMLPEASESYESVLSIVNESYQLVLVDFVVGLDGERLLTNAEGMEVVRSESPFSTLNALHRFTSGEYMSVDLSFVTTIPALLKGA